MQLLKLAKMVLKMAHSQLPSQDQLQQQLYTLKMLITIPQMDGGKIQEEDQVLNQFTLRVLLQMEHVSHTLVKMIKKH